MFGFSIKPCCVLFSPGLVDYGRAPISFSSSSRGFTLQLVPLIPWPFLHSKPAKSSTIPWEGGMWWLWKPWAALAVSSGGMLMNSPTINATSPSRQVPLYPLFRYRGSPAWWWWWGRRTAQRVVVLSKLGHLKPKFQVPRVEETSDWVLRKWVNYFRLVERDH